MLNNYVIYFISVALSLNRVFISMVVVMLLIILGFYTRVVKLYKPILVRFFG